MTPRIEASGRTPLGKVAVWLAALLFLATTACGLLDGLKTAETEVEVFHSQFNSGQYRQMYLDTDEALRQSAGEADFVALIEAVHRKLGNLEETTRAGFDVRWDGGGHWVSLSYQSRFTHGEAVEEFVWRIDADKAKLVSYNINSPALILR